MRKECKPCHWTNKGHRVQEKRQRWLRWLKKVKKRRDKLNVLGLENIRGLWARSEWSLYDWRHTEGLDELKSNNWNPSVSSPIETKTAVLHMEASFILQNIKPFVKIFRSQDFLRYFSLLAKQHFRFLFFWVRRRKEIGQFQLGSKTKNKTKKNKAWDQNQNQNKTPAPLLKLQRMKINARIYYCISLLIRPNLCPTHK